MAGTPDPFPARARLVAWFLWALGLTYAASELLQRTLPSFSVVLFSPEQGAEEEFVTSPSPLVDLVLLSVVQPVLLFHVLWKHDPGFSGGGRWARMLAVLGVALTAVGHGAHVVANLFEHPARSQATSQLHGLIYFYDEYLGHALIVGGLLCFLAAALVVEPNLKPLVRGDRARRDVPLLALAGLAFGGTFAMSTIEGQSVLVTAVGTTALATWSIRAAGGLKGLRGRPVALFVVVVWLAVLATAAVWAALTGVRSTYSFFVQPSEL
ncbi:MAG: hypothetical protein Kow0069_11650 [Promethearchaeota archaeon]